MFFKKIINKGYEADQCQICGNQFKLIKFDRIHKCKRCFKFICQNCGDSKEFVIQQDGNISEEKHRVCIKCKSDIHLIRQNMENYNLKWAHNSKLSIEWLANIQKSGRKKDYQYNHFLNLYFKSGDRFLEETQIIDKDVIRGRTDFSVFNYSMKQFFYMVQLGVEDQHTTRLNIANVLYAIAARFNKVGYCQGMSGIAAFLLCFADQETAFCIFSDLIENIFPSMFFQRSTSGVALIGLLSETFFLKEYFEYYVKTIKKNLLLRQREEYTDDELNHFKIVIQLTSTKALLSIFIGILNFSNLMFVWQELKTKRSFQVIEKSLLSIIYLHRNKIIEERSFKKLQEYFQKLDGQLFQQAYYDIDIDQEIKKNLIQQFHIKNNKKWNSSGTGNSYTLSKITSLTQDDIKLLQKHFCKNFTNQEMAEKIVIKQDQFIDLVKNYYKILKEESPEGQSILEISEYFLKKIFAGYLSNGEEGLIFRQFVCCFSTCTKSQLKDRIFAIVKTLKDEDSMVAYDHFNKLISSIISITPHQLIYKKESFLERISKMFTAKDKITLNQLQILLNDELIFELSLFITFECENIIKLLLNRIDAAKIIQANQITEAKKVGPQQCENEG